jgi:hypothetical protein
MPDRFGSEHLVIYKPLPRPRPGNDILEEYDHGRAKAFVGLECAAETK